MPSAFIMFAQIMNLGMTVMAGCYCIGCAGFYDLVGFETTVFSPCFGKSCLEKSAAAATAVIVGAVGGHIDEIFFTYDFFHHIAKVFSHRITKGFSNKLARILNGKLDFQILIPVGIDLQFAFTNPLGIILNDALDFKVVRNVEFFQSGPDCE
jgi:hypothetical protein